MDGGHYAPFDSPQPTDGQTGATDGGGRVVKKLEPVGRGRAQVRPGVHRVHEKASNL